MKVLFVATDFTESADLDFLPAVGHYVRTGVKLYRVERVEWRVTVGWSVEIVLSEVVTFSQENESETTVQ